MKIKELLVGIVEGGPDAKRLNDRVYEGGPDPEDPRGVRPSIGTGVLPVPSNFVTPVLAAPAGPRPPTPVSPILSTNPGGPETALDMRNMAVSDGLPTAMGTTAGTTAPAGMAGDSSIPDLPRRRNQ
jgi:hypothetical protein